MVSALILALAMAADTHCTHGGEDEPPLCPTHLPAISAVTIEQTGARAYAESGGPASCAVFRPTRAQVRRYLTEARSTDAQSADATLDRSPCYSSGQVRFADGRAGRWKIEQLRVGSLVLTGRQPMLLYCRTCRMRPFVW